MYVLSATQYPNEAWVNEQAAAFLKYAKKGKLGAEVVMHDRDNKFARSFEAELENAGLLVKWAVYRSPNTCAFVERFIQTLGQECLDHFVALGEWHLNYLVREFLEHFHLERPHQALETYEERVSGTISDAGALDTHTVTIDWGDDTQSQATVDPIARTFTAEHVYRDDPQGTSAAEQYQVTVRVTDDDLGAAETARQVSVDNVAPTVTITGSPIEAFRNTPVALAAIATDASPLDTFTFAWEVTLNGATVFEGDGPTFTFTPTVAGSYVISLEGGDDDGGVGVTQTTLTVFACNVPGDTDDDCDVDLDDLNRVRNHFGESGLGVIDLPFTASIPGTIWDKDGVGTGFTHRLPGAGSGLPLVDPNLDLSPGANGRLFFKSTNADPGSGTNLDQLEAVGVLKAGLGQSDLDLTATFLDVPTIPTNGALTLYTGTAWDEVVRVGFRDSNSYTMVINRGNGDEVLYASPASAFATGDDVTLTLSRRGGLWSVAWQNATTPGASGESPAFNLDWLNVADDLHLGVLHAAPGALTHQNVFCFTLNETFWDVCLVTLSGMFERQLALPLFEVGFFAALSGCGQFGAAGGFVVLSWKSLWGRRKKWGWFFERCCAEGWIYCDWLRGGGGFFGDWLLGAGLREGFVILAMGALSGCGESLLAARVGRIGQWNCGISGRCKKTVLGRCAPWVGRGVGGRGCGG